MALALLLGVLLFLTAYPMGMLVYGSLHTTPPGEAGTFSLDGYRAMLSRENGLVLLNTIGLSLVKTALALILALFLAWVVARTDTPYGDTLEVPRAPSNPTACCPMPRARWRPSRPAGRACRST